MFRISLSRTVSPDIGVSLPATTGEIKETYSLLNGTDMIPLGATTVYMGLSIPDLRHCLYEASVTRKRLEELSYLAYRVRWMDSQGETVFGIVTEMMEPETLQDIINLSCNIDKLRYLPGVTTEVRLGEHLPRGNADMAMEERAARSNYEGTGRNYTKKRDGMFHAPSYTSGSQGELEPIYRRKELSDPNCKQICSSRVWVYKGSPYSNYTLTLPTIESRMNALKSAMRISN